MSWALAFLRHARQAPNPAGQDAKRLRKLGSLGGVELVESTRDCNDIYDGRCAASFTHESIPKCKIVPIHRDSTECIVTSVFGIMFRRLHGPASPRIWHSCLLFKALKALSLVLCRALGAASSNVPSRPCGDAGSSIHASIPSLLPIWPWPRWLGLGSRPWTPLLGALTTGCSIHHSVMDRRNPKT